MSLRLVLPVGSAYARTTSLFIHCTAGRRKNPAGNIGPLPVALTRSGPGQFVANGVVVPVAGTWQLSVKVRSTEFNQTTVDTDIVMQ